MNKGLKVGLVILIILSLWFGSSYLVYKGVMAIINWQPWNEVTVEHEKYYETVLEDIDTSFIERGIDVFKTFRLPIEIDSWYLDNENRTIQHVESMSQASNIYLFINLLQSDFSNGSFQYVRDFNVLEYEKDKGVFYTHLAVIQSVSSNKYKKSIELEFYTTDNEPFRDELFQTLINNLVDDKFQFNVLEKEFTDFLDGKSYSANMFYTEGRIAGAEAYQTIFFDKAHVDYNDDAMVGFHLDTEKPIYRFSYTIVLLHTGY